MTCGMRGGHVRSRGWSRRRTARTRAAARPCPPAARSDIHRSGQRGPGRATISAPAQRRSPMKVRAAVAHAAGKPLTVETVELEGPRAGEVLVEMKAAGVCHTDAYTL